VTVMRSRRWCRFRVLRDDGTIMQREQPIVASRAGMATRAQRMMVASRRLCANASSYRERRCGLQACARVSELTLCAARGTFVRWRCNVGSMAEQSCAHAGTACVPPTVGILASACRCKCGGLFGGVGALRAAAAGADAFPFLWSWASCGRGGPTAGDFGRRAMLLRRAIAPREEARVM